jgi:ABC-2 type transport system permease protein
MTGQADALPAARRRKRKNIKSQGPDVPQQRQSRAAATPKVDLGPRFRAGWRIIAGKEFADYLSSWRLFGLALLLALTGAAAVFATGGVIKSFAPQAQGTQSLFLILFAPPSTLQQLNQIPPFVQFVTFLGPLLGIAFGFDAINGERSEATLPRLLAQPIYRDDVINGKFVAGLTSIGLILAVVMALVGAVGIIQLGIFPSAEDVLRLIVWWVLALMYIGFWLAFALLCSVLVRRAATSAIMALSVWLLLSVFFALVVGLVANFLSPVSADSTAASPDTVANTAMQINLGRLSPYNLFQEATAAVLNPTIRTTTPGLVTESQASQAVASLLPLDQSLLVIWPQFVAIIGVTMVTFGAAYVAFMRQEVRA